MNPTSMAQTNLSDRIYIQLFLLLLIFSEDQKQPAATDNMTTTQEKSSYS